MRAAGHRVVVALAPDGIAAFTDEGAVLTAVCDDEPVLTEHGQAERLARLVTAVHRATGASVYLPLVAAAHAESCARAGCTVWRRPPNSLIDWSRDGADLWERALARGSSQLRRKRRLVERDGLTLRPGTSGAGAFAHVLAVDDRSWKARQGQSMRLRGGQDALYGHLVDTGEVTAALLLDGERPVAFRLDARVGDRLTSLKWSYDENYRRYSPGLYLLTEGLRQEWAGRGVRTVDLHGSPDALKDLLHSERVPRADVCAAPRTGPPSGHVSARTWTPGWPAPTRRGRAAPCLRLTRWWTPRSGTCWTVGGSPPRRSAPPAARRSKRPWKCWRWARAPRSWCPTSAATPSPRPSSASARCRCSSASARA
ncbi:GNAT family N-acetyltransferase [Streptomyces albulus]|nr:GNAT family N-acetyltransferase [Streptomyces noursei]